MLLFFSQLPNYYVVNNSNLNMQTEVKLSLGHFGIGMSKSVWWAFLLYTLSLWFEYRLIWSNWKVKFHLILVATVTRLCFTH